MLLQLHDKGLISTQKLLSEFNIDYDQEINRLREEQITAGKGGQVSGPSSVGGDMGMGGGGMDLGLGGGGGGMPPGLSGPDMGAGVPPMPAGPEAGMSPGPAAPATPPGPMAASSDLVKTAQMSAPSGAASIPDKVYKKGKEPKKKEDDTPVENKQIFLTKPEQKLYKIIQGLNLPLRLFAQYEQQVPGVQNAYLLDFAFPEILLDLEADGDFWHSDPESLQKDKERDLKLASLGWTIVRLRESALNSQVDSVTEIIKNSIREAVEKKRSMMMKKASYMSDQYDVEEIEDDYFVIIKPIRV
jgi:very-short-patch-repair endonuclease